MTINDRNTASVCINKHQIKDVLVEEMLLNNFLFAFLDVEFITLPKVQNKQLRIYFYFLRFSGFHGTIHL